MLEEKIQQIILSFVRNRVDWITYNYVFQCSGAA